jgi:hypothetical protein
MSNICGVSPVNQVINAYVRNVDAVDVAADSVSCTHLTVNGENISGLFQNVTSIPNKTTFTGNVEATGFVAGSNGIGVSGDLVVFPPGKLRVNGNIEQSGVVTTTLKNTTVDNLTAKGTTTLKTTTIEGDLTQTSAGTVVMTDVYLDSLYVAGGTELVSLTSGGTTLNGTTTVTGNLGQTAGTTSLKQLSVGGNIAQTTGTSTLKALTCDTLTLSSGGIITYTPVSVSVTTGTSVTLTGISASANVLEVTFHNIGINNNNGLVLRLGTGGAVVQTNVYAFACNQSWNVVSGYGYVTVGNKLQSGWQITQNLNNNERIYGTLRLTKVGTNYVMEGTFKASGGTDETIIYQNVGFVALGGVCDRIQLASQSLASTFNGTGTMQVIAR